LSIIDFSVQETGPVSYMGPNLGASTQLNLSLDTLTVSSVGTDDNASGLATGNTITISPLTIDYGSGAGPNSVSITKSWTDGLGTFTETLTSAQIFRIPGVKNAITILLSGTLTGPGGLLDVPATLLISATQVRGPGIGHAVSISMTNAAQFGAIPEPSTWVMLALGFGGLAYAAVRRSAKDRSALAI
jgi:hypothetical protein